MNPATETFKRQLIGCDSQGTIPDGLLYGVEFNADMLTMIGYKRLTNLEVLLADIVAKGIVGDVIETGVWRGGACLFMRKVLNDLGSSKVVYAADSFCGLPMPDAKYPEDQGDNHHAVGMLAVSKEVVAGHFARHGLLDKVVFLAGWFKDTLPTLAAHRFSLVRLDGDMYGSTHEGLSHLYPRLSPGGYCVVDDYGIVRGCHIAVDDYRREHGVSAELEPIDGCGVFWRKEAA